MSHLFITVMGSCLGPVGEIRNESSRMGSQAVVIISVDATNGGETCWTVPVISPR